MNVLSEFLIIALSAAVLQNAVFTRGLGSSRDTLMMGAPAASLRSARRSPLSPSFPPRSRGRSTGCCASSSSPPGSASAIWTSISTLACVCAVFTLLYLVTRAWFPRIHYPLRRDAANAAFSCAVLGTILIAFSGGYGFVKTVGFAFGSGSATPLPCCSCGRDAAASPCPTCPAPSAGCPSCCSISESSPWRSMG